MSVMAILRQLPISADRLGKAVDGWDVSSLPTIQLESGSVFSHLIVPYLALGHSCPRKNLRPSRSSECNDTFTIS
jgi:hypothetical protein